MPELVKRFLAEAGVLDAVPWNGPSAGLDSSPVPYCQPPAFNSYDWDYSSDTLDDAVPGPDVAQVLILQARLCQTHSLAQQSCIACVH